MWGASGPRGREGARAGLVCLALVPKHSTASASTPLSGGPSRLSQPPGKGTMLPADKVG